MDHETPGGDAKNDDAYKNLPKKDRNYYEKGRPKGGAENRRKKMNENECARRRRDIEAWWMVSPATLRTCLRRRMGA
jgi:hypothetical protein